MRLFKTMCALALVLGLAYPVYAEVQNVKVSGDIATRSFYKSDFDLSDGTNGNVAAGTADDSIFVASFSHIGVNADLTDNVSAEVGLSNQRLWAYEGTTAGAGDIDLYTSYVTLKEFFYSPLTIRVGLQPLQFGRGFIVGAGLLGDPSGGISSGTIADGNAKTPTTMQTNGLGFQGAREYSMLNNYNALRTTLDFSPFTIDAIAATLNETVKNNNDQTLWGINVGYKFDNWNADAEGYWFYKDDQAYNLTLHQGPGESQGRNFEVNQVHTFGLRGNVEPVNQLKLDAEVAFQTGEIADTTNDGGSYITFTRQTRDRSAWAADVSGEYTFDTVYSPSLGLGWVFFQGEEVAGDSSGNTNRNGKFNAWDGMYRGRFYTAIQDFLGGYQASNLYGTNDPDDTAASTNRNLVRVFGNAKPLDALKVNLVWVRALFDEKPIAGRSKHAGDEIDAQLIYSYTEDVTLGLLGAWFLPGRYYDGQLIAANRSNDTATAVVATVSVMF